MRSQGREDGEAQVTRLLVRSKETANNSKGEQQGVAKYHRKSPPARQRAEAAGGADGDTQCCQEHKAIGAQSPLNMQVSKFPS